MSAPNKSFLLSNPKTLYYLPLNHIYFLILIFSFMQSSHQSSYHLSSCYTSSFLFCVAFSQRFVHPEWQSFARLFMSFLILIVHGLVYILFPNPFHTFHSQMQSYPFLNSQSPFCEAVLVVERAMLPKMSVPYIQEYRWDTHSNTH